MSKTYENLLKPLKIGKLTVPNRFSVAPMATGFYIKPTGEFLPAGIDYFVRRAQGGFGLIFTGAMACDNVVDPDVSFCANPFKDPAAFRKTSMELNRKINAYGSYAFAQVTLGLGKNYPGCHAPSKLPVYANPDLESPEITVEQIKKKIQLMAQVAVMVKDAGYAGIEIHAMHWGYLIDQFASSLTNKRTDQYGGSLENRLRVAKEVREAIAASCGPDFPVSIRLGMKSYVKDIQHGSVTGDPEAGRTPEEAVEIAKLLEAYGYDLLSVDTGVYESFYYACPPMYVERGFAIEMAAKIKEAVSIPVILGGRMGSADLAEQAVADGKVDGVVLGRPSLADPDFPKKVRMGLPETIRPCIACNQGCLYRLNEVGVDAYCAVNAEVGQGTESGLTKAAAKKKVTIIGGGVAGMEAARVCSLRGHDVSLYEKTDVLGGNLIPAGAHEFKVEISELNQWYQDQMKRLGVDIHMNTEMDADKIQATGCDAVVFGLGSTPVMPQQIPGINHEKSASCIDVLTRKKAIGQKVVVVGGGLVGCEIALECIREGKDVTIVEAAPQILSAGAPVPHPNKSMLLDTFEHEQTPIRTNCFLAGINDEGAEITTNDGQKETIPADTVVVAIGFRPLPSFASQLEGKGMELYEVGDGKSVGNILNAVWDAYEVASHI